MGGLPLAGTRTGCSNQVKKGVLTRTRVGGVHIKVNPTHLPAACALGPLPLFVQREAAVGRRLGHVGGVPQVGLGGDEIVCTRVRFMNAPCMYVT